MNGRILSVLIVDDAIPIRQRLSMMDWNSFGSLLVGEASNGEEALEFCREYEPDVVITDIKMPLMDGLELSRRLKKEFPNVQIILLTCHSEFEYVKEALNLGAVDYIIKVLMKEEDLERALQKAREGIEREQLCKSSTKGKQRIRLSRILGDVISTKSNFTPSLNAILREQGYKIEYPIRLVYLHVISPPSNMIFIDQEISGFLDEHEADYLWLNPVTGVYALLFNNYSLEERSFIDKLDVLIDSLYKILDRELYFVSGKVRLFATTSNILVEDDEFFEAVLQFDTWNELSFYEVGQTVFSGYCKTMRNLEVDRANEIKTQLQAVSTSSEDLSSFVKDKFYNWALDSRIKPVELKTLVLDMFNDFESIDREGKVTLLKVLQTNNIDELFEVLVQQLGLNVSQRGSIRHEVKEAIKIVNENISSPLSLSFISSKVALSPFYLGKVFSEEVGESFNDYVTKIRMKRAVELLQSTNMKVYEVAEKVGIPNYRYFSNLFKNWTGQTPKEYKRG